MLRLTAALTSLCLLATAAYPADVESDAFEDRVRAYLLKHPEVILEALEILAEREARAAMAERIAAFPDLFAPTALGLGRADAPLRVVEFFDYRCAPCKAMHPGLEALVAETPDLRIEMRHLPILSPGSERASRFALAVQALAGDEAYRQVHHALWTARGAMTSALFARIAAKAGLDFDAIEPMMESAEITARIDANRDAAIALELYGTPAFVSTSHITFGQQDIGDLAALWRAQ